MSAELMPFSQFVLKVHSRCNIACDHCYMYEAADQSWRTRPMTMPAETVAATAARIAEHAAAHGLPEVQVVLHGGEPLLAGAAELRRTVETLDDAISGVCALRLGIQTNGILLDEDFLTLFDDFDVRVGVSLDGDRAANDLHRRYADGRSSHDLAVAGIDRLRALRYRHLYGGLLCTVDVRNDPIAAYSALAELEPPTVNFLLPHATWDTPPVRPGGAATPYADWLNAVYDHWTACGRPFDVSFFESVIDTSNGEPSRIEALGLSPMALVVVEADGTLEQVDSLKVAYEGAARTGLDVRANSLDEAAAHPGVRVRQIGLDGLSPVCRACRVVESCGGGQYPHRYRTDHADPAASGFANPSVYCQDLMAHIDHVRARMAAVTEPRDEAPGHDAPARPALSPGSVDQLAAGYGDAATIAELVDAQRAASRAVLAGAVANVPGAPEEAWALMTELDRAAPAAARDVLAYPYVRAWAADLIARHGSGTARPAELSGIAMAIAIRAGAEAALRVPIRAGAVHLPSLGRVLVEGTARKAVVRASATGFTVTTGRETVEIGPPGGHSPAWWQPVRPIGDAGRPVVLDDVDPHRDTHGSPAADRLPGSVAASWRRAFAHSWEQIGRDHPAYLPGLAGGVKVVMPMARPAAATMTSGTARQAFGAIGVALPDDADMLALLMIHEFQHNKLGAILDHFDVLDPADERLLRVAWRPDPRPLEATLQGVYAHLGVTDFWRVHRRVAATREAREQAGVQFGTWRRATADALDLLAGTGALTEFGAALTDRMRATIEPWLTEPAP